MIVLGIETSCDETAISILDVHADARASILSEFISSQTKLHELYGGVVPELASREHLKALPALLDGALAKAGKHLADIELVAVTQGPGLKGCLLIGVGFAKALSISQSVSLVGVNHIEGHILSPLLTTSLTFPYLALVVSGGHTELHRVDDVGCYQLLARTIDDAAGEAFDKSANLLGIGYPGGAALARLADEHGHTTFTLPKVMREAEGFSFSGLKTAIQLLVRKQQAMTEEVRADLAFAIQEAIVDAVTFKVRRAVEQTGLRRIAVVGGVAANRRLRESLAAIPGAELYAPSALHCTDNASMIAFTGVLRYLRGERMTLDSSALARWPVETCGLPCA